MHTIHFTDSVKDNALKTKKRYSKMNIKNSLYNIDSKKQLIDDIAFLIYKSQTDV